MNDKKQNHAESAVFGAVETIMDISKTSLKITDSFEELGCDSLDMVEIVMDVEDSLNIELSDESWENCKTLGDLVVISKAQL
jgi:acyl carrier protein